ncbi:uncharacterized protein LOC127881880 [Dreissena polymorpha]|uniref:Uncharacterized protein n=1 Tax=Dreissena polymorpha TaxID=45954 RepID=A0A9D4JYC9_DREPO|nr:uncharacterized protein LOC127881880 [Dreissena polymorpha]XP_052286021.1 uncharacterized protein LOC127881880 [Dreissena polymorpha]XP_052286022.1 uncharacterized protein LOC127881880 [Dreissena polymorpha]XP_052286023.1 uncharacterized protein LOC127881880 [Dreissena polymorpha]XP_052286024.1 uncharacterized protein LOC127881880 [Dreissena polymorpha]XP_052286025.1 uncharacterized protein LOC127881880 [Dreissena polymorpha]XP_052286026.1 uncharacterized protein LOC127881880 [Dreissena po
MLRRFMTRRMCPHFTIEYVNLFDGKIERHGFPKLMDKLTNVIKSLRAKIEKIQMDSIGKTLNEQIARKNDIRTYCVNGSALLNYVFNILQEVTQWFYEIEFSLKPVNGRRALFANALTLVETYYRTPLEKYRKYDYALHTMMTRLASVVASAYLEQKAEGHEYNHDDMNSARQMYIQSLESDIIGNYMRYASFLFCNGKYNKACRYFNLIEQKIEEDKKSNLIYQFVVSPSETLALQIAKQSCEQSFKQKWSVCLMFRPEESMCVPDFLRCEMYRGRFMLSIYSKEDCICVPIEPYLYYLQYLTYRELHQDRKQSEALKKLSNFTKNIKPTILIPSHSESHGDIWLSFPYFDTSLNMLGHCFELEQKFELAWRTYTTSLQLLPDGNAAILHKTRLLWQVMQSLQT